ncbi:MAG: hypothetical protein CMH58_10445 [Myxococcales bacterium]|nr:hypothetical protein [Myxococcales bacterium]
MSFFQIFILIKQLINLFLQSNIYIVQLINFIVQLIIFIVQLIIFIAQFFIYVPCVKLINLIFAINFISFIEQMSYSNIFIVRLHFTLW